MTNAEPLLGGVELGGTKCKAGPLGALALAMDAHRSAARSA
jgi:hypothetical protein